MKLQFSAEFTIDTDREPWRREGLRVAMLGGPGSGKSWNNSLLAEQFLSQGGTVVIFQPRDEYYTLKEKFDVLSVGGVHAQDIPFALTSPSLYAKSVVDDGLSMVFYTSAAEDEEKLIQWVTRFISYVLKYQERQKRPVLLILEEAQEYAPRSASGHIAPPWVYNRMIKAFKDCFTQGRKLNIIAVASSQRPQELNFTIRQLANLTFYGKFTDQDIGYIDKECLKYVRKQGVSIDAAQLLNLGLGEWLVVMGRNSRFIKVTQPRLTKHGAETPTLDSVAPRKAKVRKTVDDLAQTLEAAMQQEAEEQSALEKAKRKIRSLEGKLKVAEEKAQIKLSVKEMLSKGGGEAELAEKLAKAKRRITWLDAKLKAITGQEAQRCDQLEEAHRKLEKYQALDQALAAIIKVNMPKSLPTDMPDASPGNAVTLQNTTNLVNVERAVKKATVSDETIRGKVLRLAEDGFLQEAWRGLGEIHGALINRFGWTIAKGSLKRELNRMASDFILGSKKDPGRKQVVYRLSAGVQFQEAA
jgi:hypothetical protein